MALPMPRPFEHKNGTFYINVRLPADMLPGLKGTTVVLPIGGVSIETALTDKVFLQSPDQGLRAR